MANSETGAHLKSALYHIWHQTLDPCFLFFRRVVVGCCWSIPFLRSIELNPNTMSQFSHMPVYASMIHSCLACVLLPCPSYASWHVSNFCLHRIQHSRFNHASFVQFFGNQDSWNPENSAGTKGTQLITSRFNRCGRYIHRNAASVPSRRLGQPWLNSNAAFSQYFCYTGTIQEHTPPGTNSLGSARQILNPEWKLCRYHKLPSMFVI